MLERVWMLTQTERFQLRASTQIQSGMGPKTRYECRGEPVIVSRQQYVTGLECQTGDDLISHCEV